MRIGHGYDAHRLAPGRKLILGGVEIPYEKGLEGHSDADVLLHAIMDAMLGAAGMGDIGSHFPDTEMAYKGVYSIVLLEKTLGIISSLGYKVTNVDSTIIAQAPKLAPYNHLMRECIAKALEMDIGFINVKATTEEKMGFTGEGLGIAAHAVVLLENVEI